MRDDVGIYMSLDSHGSRIIASVIVPTKNGGRYFRSVLEGLHGQRGSERTEVIVIDSGSTDDTLRIVADFPAIRLIQIPPHEFGHGRTRNLGARQARGEFLVFIPQDATPVGADWLDSLLAPFAATAIAGVFSRQVARADASPMEAFFLARTYPEQAAVKTLAGGEEPSLARCFFSTVGGAIRASVWAQHPFREDIIMSEDQAWASEVMRAGHAVAYQPSAELLHSHHYGVGDIFRRNFDSGYSVRQIFSGATGIGPATALANLAAEGVAVATSGSMLDWLKFVPYEVSRHAGFWLGMHGDRLPVRLCRACSGLAYFWDQRLQEKGRAG